jgi:hypothetical protein
LRDCDQYAVAVVCRQSDNPGLIGRILFHVVIVAAQGLPLGRYAIIMDDILVVSITLRCPGEPALALRLPALGIDTVLQDVIRQ